MERLRIMKSYTHLDDEERAVIGKLLCRRFGIRRIARVLGRSPSTVSREIRRNQYPNRDCYLSLHAGSMARGRRRRARQGTHFSLAQLGRVVELLEEDYSPEQVSGWLLGSTRACILTLVDRKTGYLMIGKLAARTIEETNRRLRMLIERRPRDFRTITADNGCEFHGYEDIELSHGAHFYFAPHHSWERGSNENANGLIRQYLPKGTCMANLTQGDCDRIADKLNARPR